MVNFLANSNQCGHDDVKLCYIVHEHGKTIRAMLQGGLEHEDV